MKCKTGLNLDLEYIYISGCDDKNEGFWLFESMHLLKISIGGLFLIKVNFLDFLCLTFYSKALFHDPHNPFPIGLLFEGRGW